MKGKRRIIRIAVTSCMLAALFAVGVTVMQTENTQKKEEIKNELAQLEKDQEMQSQTEDTIEPDVNADTDQVQAEIPDAIGHLDNQEIALNENAGEEGSSTTPTPPEEATITPGEEENEETVQMEEETVESANLNFSENSTMIWPVEGQVLIDYSMDATVFFPTLKQYRYSPAIYIQSTTDTPVVAAAQGTITNIEETYHTGNTITMDLGNGYQAVYGFLKDIEQEVGTTVDAGTVLGHVDVPRAEYAAEDTGLYFAMRHNGENIDPILNLPGEEEE